MFQTGYAIGGSYHFSSNKTYTFPAPDGWKTEYTEGTRVEGLDLWDNETPVWEGRNGEFGTTLFTRKAVDVIKKHDHEKVG